MDYVDAWANSEAYRRGWLSGAWLGFVLGFACAAVVAVVLGGA